MNILSKIITYSERKTVMKKLIALVLSVLMLTAVLAGCGSGTSLADVRKAGTLTIATSPDFPPFESLGEGNVVEGIEIDVLNKVCEQLGVTLTIQQMEFDSVLAGIAAGKFDLGASGITVTESRKKNMLFTDPYCLAAQAIVVKAGSTVQTKADLAGKKVSVQTATTAEEYCMGNGYEVSAYEDNEVAQMALLNGNVDAWVIDDLTAAEMVKAYNEENGEGALVILPEAMTTEPYAFALQPGSDELAAEINKIVNQMVADGTMAAIFEKYEAPYTAPHN